MKKKLISMFLAFSVIAASVVNTGTVAFASTPAGLTFVAGDVSGDPGDEVELVISVAGNSSATSFAGGKIDVTYDNTVLEVVPYFDEEAGESYHAKPGTIGGPFGIYVTGDLSPTKFVLSFGRTGGAASTDGEFYIVTFKIKDDATPGTVANITLEPAGIVSSTGVARESAAQNGSVTVNVPNLNKAALDAGIASAKAVRDAAIIDTNAANVYINQKWTTQANKDTLNTAITTAENTTYLSQSQVDTMVTTLSSAVAAFEATKQNGTKPFTITFNPNGGEWETGSDNVVLTTGQDGKVAAPAEPTKKSNIFKGWFTAASGGTAVNLASNVFNANTTLYAQWQTSTIPGGNTGGSGGSGGSGGTTTTPGEVTANDVTTVSGAKDGETVKIEGENVAQMPSTVLDIIKGKDVTLEVDAGDATIVFNGKDLGDVTGTLDIAVKASNKTTVISTPTATITETVNKLASTQLKIGSGTTAQSFNAAVALDVGKDSAGKAAVVLKWNDKTKEFEFVSANEVGADGKVNAKVNGTGEYLVVTASIGDVDKDGKLSVKDATNLLKGLIGATKLDPMSRALANSKGAAPSAADATNILKFLIGLIDKI